MDRLFGEMVRGIRGNGTAAAVLPVDIKETDTAVVVEASVPGFKPEELEVTIEEGVLTIQAQREGSAESKDGYLRRERHWGSLYRQVALPWEVQSDQAEANFDNGVLTITLPKAPSSPPVKVQVSTNGQKALDSDSNRK